LLSHHVNLLEVLDPRTLAISASLTGLVFSGVLRAAIADGDPIAGALDWFSAALLTSLALCANAMQDIMPDIVSRVIANVCLTTAGFLLWQGARAYNGRSSVMHIVYVAAAVVAVCNFVFVFIWPSAQYRIICTSIGLSVGASLAAYEIGRARAAHLKIGVQVARTALYVFALFMLVRTIHAFIGGATPGSLTQSPMNTAAHLAGNLVLLTTMAGLVIIVNSTRAAQVRALAYSDQLTGVLSRRGFYSEVRNYADRPIKSGVVFVFDVDQFKASNGSKGHETGDRLLKLLGDTLREHAPADSLIARFGGDEFVVLSQNVDDAEAFATTTRKKFCARSISILNDSTLVGSGQSLKSIDVSIGWARCERFDEPHLSMALNRADRAMYETKIRQRSLQPA
jgi:diguanylate cyclase (GGDEF)-like protein